LVTIYDIAKKAGVSTATVSYVIRNTKNVRKTTKEKVLKAIKKLKYEPSNVAQSLSTRQTKTIAFIVPHIHSPSLSEIVSGAEKKANKSGYSLYLCNSENDIEIEKSFISNLKKKWIDGILIITENKDVLDLIEDSKIPYLLVDRDFDINREKIVRINFMDASYKIVNHLIETGCRKIAIINGPKSIQPSMKKFEGYKKALKEKNLFDDSLVFFSDKDIISDFVYSIGAKTTNKIIKNKIEVDAIFCGNDLIAIGAINILFEHNIKIPEEVSIISADESYLTKDFKPKLTKIRFPYNALGQKAVSLIYEKINKKNGKKTRVKNIIEGKIIIGETTKQ